MKKDLTPYVEAVLHGQSMRSQSDLAGVNVNTLRREVLKHPNYEAAKAEGKLHTWSKPPTLRAAAENHPAVDEVVAGATLLETAAKYNLPLSSLRTMVKIANPDLNLLHREKSPEDIAAEQELLTKATEECADPAVNIADVARKYSLKYITLAQRVKRARAKYTPPTQAVRSPLPTLWAVSDEDGEFVRDLLKDPTLGPKLVAMARTLAA